MSDLFNKALQGQGSGFQLLRFLIVGASNTILSSFLYLLLLSFMSHSLSYATAYLSGTLYSGIINSKFTFSVPLRSKRLSGFIIFYIVIYFINAAVLELTIRYFGIGERLAILVVIAVGIPLGFFGSRLILTDRFLGNI